jgi:hypothetical protein
MSFNALLDEKKKEHITMIERERESTELVQLSAKQDVLTSIDLALPESET